MRYTKIALSIFGLGLVLGLVVVAGEFARLERVASMVMALGLVLLPVALFADGRGIAMLTWIAACFSRQAKEGAPENPALDASAAAPETAEPGRARAASHAALTLFRWRGPAMPLRR